MTRSAFLTSGWRSVPRPSAVKMTGAPVSAATCAARGGGWTSERGGSGDPAGRRPRGPPRGGRAVARDTLCVQRPASVGPGGQVARTMEKSTTVWPWRASSRASSTVWVRAGCCQRAGRAARRARRHLLSAPPAQGESDPILFGETRSIPEGCGRTPAAALAPGRTKSLSAARRRIAGSSKGNGLAFTSRMAGVPSSRTAMSSGSSKKPSPNACSTARAT